MKNIVIITSLLLIISGCSPYVISSNPRQVTIGTARNVNAGEAQEMADKECKKHGRYAILRRAVGADSIYECEE